MTKIEQMEEFMQKAQENEALQKKFAEILQAEELEETEKWLAGLGYQFNLKELQEHMADGIPLSEDQLDAVAGGGTMNAAQISNQMVKQGNNSPLSQMQCMKFMKG